MYLRKWTSQISTEEIYQAALKIWDRELREISDEEIKKALDKLSAQYPEWPPTPGEFKALCGAVKGSARFPWAEDVLKRVNDDRPSNRSVTAEINLGAEVTKKIKQIYPDKHWFRDIPGMFTQVKKYARTIFPEHNEVELLKEIRKFSDDDYKDILEK
jgi:hypothetical protein